MNILAIDASGIAGSVAYRKDGRLVGEYYICDKLTHSQTIMPMLENLKALLKIELEEVDAVAVTSGPGSFTGLRIGVTAAKTLALALEVPIVGVPTLDVIAGAAAFAECLICPLMDARRNQVYTALYKWEGDSLQRLSDYLAIDMDEYLAMLDKKGEKILFLGDGAIAFKGAIQEVMGEKALFAPSFVNLQHASVLAEEGARRLEAGQGEDPSSFVPMYLRKSQAEREKEERERNGR